MLKNEEEKFELIDTLWNVNSIALSERRRFLTN